MSKLDCYLEVALDVEYDYAMGCPGNRTEAPEPAELEINRVILRNIHTLVKTDIIAYLTPKEISMLEQQIIDSFPGPLDYEGEF